MIVRCAFRELTRHPLRTLLAVAGVAVAGAMLVDMLMLSNGLQTSFRELLESAGYEVRVSPAGTLPLDTEATIRDAGALLERLRGSPASPASLRCWRPTCRCTASATRSVFALGVDPDEQGVFRMLSGRPPGPGEVVLGPERRRGRAPSRAGADTLSLAAFGTLGAWPAPPRAPSA